MNDVLFEIEIDWRTLERAGRLAYRRKSRFSTLTNPPGSAFMDAVPNRTCLQKSLFRHAILILFFENIYLPNVVAGRDVPGRLPLKA